MCNLIKSAQRSYVRYLLKSKLCKNMFYIFIDSVERRYKDKIVIQFIILFSIAYCYCCFI